MKTDEAIYKIIQESLFEDRFHHHLESEEIDWEAVYEELESQTISALPKVWLERHSIHNDDLEKKWKLSNLKQIICWNQMLDTQDKMIRLLESNGISVVIIKGLSSSWFYPYPELRALGDIDFLVKGKDYRKAASVLKENGYQKDFPESNHHLHLQKDGFFFELHNKLGSMGDNPRLMQMLEEGIDHAGTVKMLDKTFSVLPDRVIGLVLLLHINQHIRSGLGYRQILDWMMFVERYLSDAVWKKEFEELFRELGLEKLAITVTAMCKATFGLSENIHWCDSADPDTARQLLDLLRERGNFGRKGNWEVHHLSATFSLVRNPVDFFKRLQDGGKSHWPVKNHRWLAPLSWLFQIFYILVFFIRNHISVVQLTKVKKKGDSYYRLLRKLGLHKSKYV